MWLWISVLSLFSATAWADPTSACTQQRGFLKRRCSTLTKIINSTPSVFDQLYENCSDDIISGTLQLSSRTEKDLPQCTFSALYKNGSVITEITSSKNSVLTVRVSKLGIMTRIQTPEGEVDCFRSINNAKELSEQSEEALKQDPPIDADNNDWYTQYVIHYHKCTKKLNGKGRLDVKNVTDDLLNSIYSQTLKIKDIDKITAQPQKSELQNTKDPFQQIEQ